MTIRELIATLYIKTNGNWDDMYDLIENQTPLTESEKKEGVDFIERYGKEVIVITDSDYPLSYTLLEKPPFIIWKDERQA